MWFIINEESFNSDNILFMQKDKRIITSDNKIYFIIRMVFVNENDEHDVFFDSEKERDKAFLYNTNKLNKTKP